jgi:hypothetical protein
LLIAIVLLLLVAFGLAVFLLGLHSRSDGLILCNDHTFARGTNCLDYIRKIEALQGESCCYCVDFAQLAEEGQTGYYQFGSVLGLLSCRPFPVY